MNRLWKVAYFAGGFAPLMDAADATGAGGGADPGDGGDGSQPSDGAVDDGGDPNDGAALGEDADREEALEDLLTADDDDEPLDQTGRARPAEDRIKALAKRTKKLQRRLAKLLPIAKRTEGIDLDDLITKARNYDSLERRIASNPRLARAIYGDADDDQDTGRASRRQPAQEPEEQFDPSSIPFETETESGKYLANLARENFELKRQQRQLAQRLDQLHGAQTATVEASERSQWLAARDAAVAHIKDEGVQTLFKDAIAAAYKDRGSHRKSPQQVINHYLKVLKVTPQQASAAANAAAAAATKGGKPAGAPATGAAQRQRIAEGNRTLPRTPAPVGSPAPARQQRETVAQVNKRLRTLSPV